MWKVVFYVSAVTVSICFLFTSPLKWFQNNFTDHVICKIEKGSRIQSFEIVGDTAVVVIENQNDTTVSALIKYLDSAGLLNKDLIQARCNGHLVIQNLPRNYSTFKIPVKGIKHSIIEADVGWDNALDTIRPQTPLSLSIRIDSIGGIIPGK